MSMQWSKEKITQIACKSTPSYLLNNLTYNGTYYVYVHLNEVQITSDKKGGSSDKIAPKDVSQVTQAKWVQSNKASAGAKDSLVIATHSSVQVHDADLKQLFAFSLPSTSEGKQKFARGITTALAANKTFLFVGTSSGSVLVFEVKGKDYTFSQVLKAHAYSLCELVSDVAGGAAWASGDSYGNVVTWNGLEKDVSFAGAGYPCTSLALKGATLICGYANGTISLHNLKTRAKVVDIAAHSRSINAIDVHPTADMFVSVSDDTYVNVWGYNTDTFEVKLLFSTNFPDNLLCGVQFSGDKSTSITVAAYDYPHIAVIG